MTQNGFRAEEIDTSRPHPARIYDYLLGGKDNYEVDREAGDQLIDVAPEARIGVQSNRLFLQRAVRHVVGAGVRQILDIGTGLPTSPNVHEVAQEVAPDVRIAYVDNDPIVNTHASTLMSGAGTTSIVLADLRDPQAILTTPTSTGSSTSISRSPCSSSRSCTSSPTPSSPRRSSPPCATRSRPAATWCCPTPPATSTTVATRRAPTGRPPRA